MSTTQAGKRLRIVVFDDLPNGGAKRVVYEQVLGLSKKHEVIVVTNKELTDFHYDKSMQVFSFDLSLVQFEGLLRPLQELSYLYKLLPKYIRIKRLIMSLKPDVVLIHPSQVTQAPLLLKLLSLPTVYYAEELPRVVYESDLYPLPASSKKFYEQWRRSLLAKIDLKNARSASLLLANSRYTSKKMKVVYGRKVEALSPGVDVALFTPIPNQKKRDYFLFVGNPNHENGYDIVKGAIGLGIPKDKIKVVSFQASGFAYSDQQMRQLYGGAVATLCLSLHEPFGLVAIESMACGTPVIAIDDGGYKETVLHEKNGLLVQYNEASLYEAMLKLEQNGDYRDGLGVSGRKFVKENYNWDNHVAQLEKVLLKAIEL